MKLRVYSNSAFLLRAAIGFSRRVTSAGGRLLFFQSVFNLLPHIMHLFPSDRPPSILFAKKFRIHDSFIATPPQKMRGTLRKCLRVKWDFFRLVCHDRPRQEKQARRAAPASGTLASCRPLRTFA